MYYLPQYLWGIESGWRSGVSSSSRHPRKTAQTVPGGQSCSAVPSPAAPPRTRRTASHPPHLRAVIPALAREKKIPAGRISPSCPGFPCRPDHCARVSPPGIAPAVLCRRKNMKKKCRKIWRFGKKQYLCNPVRKEGHQRGPGAREREAGESLRMESEVH